MDDLLRLAELARLANPLAREGPHGSCDEVIVRCVCGSAAQDGELIPCPRCGCLLHEKCIEGTYNMSWQCPFCERESAGLLEGRGVDLAAFHSRIRGRADFEEFAGPASALSGHKDQIDRASAWARVVSGRADVCDQVEALARVSMPQGAAAGACDELRQEKALISDVAEILGRLAAELEELKTPVLDAVVDQILTHPQGQ